MLLHVCLLLPLCQDAPQEAANPPFFSMTYHGAGALFVDEKDRGLLQALQMIDARLLELPGELDDVPIPPPAIELLTRIFGGPLSLSMGFGTEPIAGMELPFFGELRATRGVEEARALDDDAVALLEMMGMPLDPPPAGELWELPAPVPAWMGADGSDFRICLGSPDRIEVEDFTRLLPEKARASFTGQMDYGRFLELMMNSIPGGGVELLQMKSLLDGMGLGELRYEWALGSDEGRQYLMVNMPGWGKIAREKGFLPETGLTPEVLSCIPKDATWAMASAFDFGGVMHAYQTMLDELAGPGTMDLFGMIEEATDLDVEEELIAPIGSSLCIYASDSTGGGGMFSMVAVLELADRERFLSTWSRVEEAVNGLDVPEIREYLEMRSWQHEGTEYATLMFPGLPIPLELTMATTEHHAVFGVSPQAAIAAIAQLRDPRSSLLDHPGFREQLPQEMSGCVNVQWIDTPRLMRDGYGLLGLVCSAVANGVRSPADPTREPGAILPTFHELHRGSKAMLGIARVVGDDYVVECRGDRSQLVNAAGMAGFLYNSPVAQLFALGMAMGVATAESVGEVDFEFSDEDIVAFDLELIHEALDEYAINNAGHYPATLEELVMPDENGHSYLDDSTTLIDPWGDPYEYIPPTQENSRPEVFCRHYQK